MGKTSRNGCGHLVAIRPSGIALQIYEGQRIHNKRYTA